LQDAPDELIGAELAQFIADAEALESDTRKLLFRAGELALRLDEVALKSLPLLDYSGANSVLAAKAEVLDSLANIASLLLRLRDELAKQSLPVEDSQ